MGRVLILFLIFFNFIYGENLIIQDFSTFTHDGSETSIDSNNNLKFEFTGTTSGGAYKAISKSITKGGQKFVMDFDFNSFSDGSTRRVVFGGFTNNLFLRNDPMYEYDSESWWWPGTTSEVMEGLFFGISSAHYGAENQQEGFVYTFWTQNSSGAKRLFHSQYDGVDWSYGRYKFEVDILSNTKSEMKLYKMVNNQFNLIYTKEIDYDLTGIELNYARLWNDRHQDYPIAGTYKGVLKELSIYKPTIIDLGKTHYSEAPKEWSIDVPQNYKRVEVCGYDINNLERVFKYNGWTSWLKVNGSYAYKWLSYEQGVGATWMDYVLNKEASQSEGEGACINISDMVSSGSNTIEFYHYTEGDGAYNRVRILTDETTLLTLDIPTNFSVSEGNYTNAILLRWSSVNDATSYKIYYKSPNSTTYTLLDTTNDLFYYFFTSIDEIFSFKIQACNLSGCSDYSIEKDGFLQMSCDFSQKLVDGVCINKTCRDDGYNCPSCIGEQTLKYKTDGSGYCENPICTSNETLKDGICVIKDSKPIATLTSSKKVIYFNKNMPETSMKIEIVGGEKPYVWSANYGDFKYLNSDKSIVVYVPQANITLDDTIVVTDNGDNNITISAKYIKELEVTPSVRYIFKNTETTFSIIGGIAPFEAIVEDGDAEIVSKVDNKITIKVSNLTSTLHIKFSDSAGQKVTKEIYVVDKLKLSPQIAYFNDFSGDLEIKISGGIQPYSAIASAGEVEVNENIAIYKPVIRYSEQNVTIIDALGQEAVMQILVENVANLTISPSNPKVKVESLNVFQAVSGTGDYSWSIQKGKLDKYSGESVIYTAPDYNTIDKLTLSDSSGAKFIATIIVGEATNEAKILNLKKGWNLISIPIDISLYKFGENEIPPIGSMNMNILNSYEVIWKYLNEWIENPTIINQSEGFWIKQLKDDIVEFEGDSYTPTNLTTLTKGWHLIGTGSTLNNLKELFAFQEVWVYESENGWSKNPIEIKAGEGIWIKK